ncbi:MAG: hypothetical protein VB131_07515 [Burkholderia gladioli]
MKYTIAFPKVTGKRLHGNSNIVAADYQTCNQVESMTLRLRCIAATSVIASKVPIFRIAPEAEREAHYHSTKHQRSIRGMGIHENSKDARPGIAGHVGRRGIWGLRTRRSPLGLD